MVRTKWCYTTKVTKGTGTIETFSIQLEQQINIFLPKHLEVWNEFITFAA